MSVNGSNGVQDGIDKRFLLLSSADNVLVARGPVKAGETITIDGAHPVLGISVSLGHKIARRAITTGEKLIKYGVSIGSATKDIAAGEHVHVHNVKSDYTPTYSLTETDGSAAKSS